MQEQKSQSPALRARELNSTCCSTLSSTGMRSYGSLYRIDEPEIHLNTKVQRTLLRELFRLIPENSQLWLATHSIGMVRAAQEILTEPPGVSGIRKSRNMVECSWFCQAIRDRFGVEPAAGGVGQAGLPGSTRRDSSARGRGDTWRAHRAGPRPETRWPGRSWISAAGAAGGGWRRRRLGVRGRSRGSRAGGMGTGLGAGRWRSPGG